MRWFLLNDSPRDDAARRWFRSTAIGMSHGWATAPRDRVDLRVDAVGEAPSKAPLQRQPATASTENQQSLDGYSIYEARAVAAGLAFCFSAAISVFAAGPEECGFCPVISRPSLTT